MSIHTICLRLGFISALALSSCGGDTSSTSTLEETIDKHGAKSATSADGCLSGYAGKLADLLPIEEVAAATGKDAGAGETEHNKVTKSTAYHECIYKWKGNGRLMKGVAVKVPQDDIVSIGGIEKISAQTFTMRYSTKSDEEIAEMNRTVDEQMDKALAGNSTAEANEAAEKLKKAGVSTGTAKQMTGKMTGSFGKILKAYRPVDGIGELAAWNEVSQKLIVLKDGIKFELGVNLSDDTNENKAIALTLAKVVLKKCP